MSGRNSRRSNGRHLQVVGRAGLMGTADERQEMYGHAAPIAGALGVRPLTLQVDPNLDYGTLDTSSGKIPAVEIVARLIVDGTEVGFTLIGGEDELRRFVDAIATAVGTAIALGAKQAAPTPVPDPEPTVDTGAPVSGDDGG
jgi:hypothetical protein